MLVPRDRKGQRVVLPILRQPVQGQAPLGGHLVPQSGARQGREEQCVEAVHAVLTGRVGRAPADTGRIGVQPDDERPHHQDVMPLDARHRRREASSFEEVEPLADLGQALRGRGLEPDEDARASRFRGERQQLLVVGEVDHGLRNPRLAEVRVCQRAEQRLGACEVLGSGADQVVVHHQDAALGDRPELAHDLRNGALAIPGAVEGRHAAERAVHGTPARRLNRPERIVSGEQVVPGRLDRLRSGEPPVVASFQAPVGGVFQHLRPDRVGFPCHDRVHTRHRFVDAHRGVDAAHDDGHAQAAIASREFVGARRLRRERRDADKVGRRQRPAAWSSDVLVEQGDVPLGRRQPGEHHQAEWLPHAIAVPPALLEPDDADQRVRRVDEMESHGTGTSPCTVLARRRRP